MRFRSLLIAMPVATCLFAASIPISAQSDQNLHTLIGTMDSCGCSCFPITPTPISGPTCDWICHAQFTVAAPPPHFDGQAPTSVNVELVEQAIGQCGAIQSTLPRKVQLLFWLQQHGIDYVHGLVRSPIQGYYTINLGPAN